MNERKKDYKLQQWEKTWKLCLLGALILGIGAFIALTIHEPSWPVMLFSAQTQPVAAQSSPGSSVPVPVNYTIHPIPVFSAQTGEGNVDITCDAENPYSLQVRYDKADTGETIYQSPVLNPGDHILTGTLAVPLPAGEYAVTVIVEMLDTAGNAVVTEQVAITITVQ